MKYFRKQKPAEMKINKSSSYFVFCTGIFPLSSLRVLNFVDIRFVCFLSRSLWNLNCGYHNITEWDFFHAFLEVGHAHSIQSGNWGEIFSPFLNQGLYWYMGSWWYSQLHLLLNKLCIFTMGQQFPILFFSTEILKGKVASSFIRLRSIVNVRQLLFCSWCTKTNLD